MATNREVPDTKAADAVFADEHRNDVRAGAAGAHPLPHPPLRARVLGGLEIEGVPAQRLGSRKARTLLTALAATGGRPVPVGILSELLWREQAPARPADQLSVLVSRLRRVIGAYRIERTDAGYALRADWFDVVEIDARTQEAASRLAAGGARAARAAADAALELVRGPLAAEEDEPGFDGQRAVVARIVARARSVLADSALASGDPGTAVIAAEAARDDDPYDEAALRTLMRAHVALGRPASALAAYATARARLGEDLGVDPSPATEALHTAILLGDTPPDLVTVEDARPIIGRTLELASLDTSLGRAESGPAIGLVIEGEPGIGKTTLVEAFGARVATRALLLVGRCDPLGRELPLQPLLDGLEHELRILGDAAIDVLAADTAIVGPLVGRTTETETAGVTTLRDAEAGQGVLFRSLLSVIERLAAGRPMVVVVEDIHLAGPSTVEWLHFALQRGRRLLVVATRRPQSGPTLHTAERLVLGPLDIDAAVALVGPERAAEIHARSRGNPLFMVELSAADDVELPASIRDVATARIDALGDTAALTLRAAAVLGSTIDLDLLATVLDRRFDELLDDLESAIEARLLTEADVTMRFTHEIVREAIVATTTAVRQAYFHRQAATALESRPASDPLDVAWHARRGGDGGLAATAMLRAGREAAARFDLAEADRLLTDALRLSDGVDVRLERARARMAVWDLEGARGDAERAIELGAGVRGLELAGWVAYYQRLFDDARRLADEGIAIASEPALRASCLALAGRIRHTDGDLARANELLEEAVAIAPPELRGVANIWLGALRVHQGDSEEAVEHAARGCIDSDRISHPFAPLHGLFVQAHGLGVKGRAGESLAVIDRLDALMVQEGAQASRFEPIAHNLRAWIFRSLGALDVANEHNAVAAALPIGVPAFAEPRYAGHLDLIDGCLAVDDLDGAAARVEAISDITTWIGSMAWHQRQRYGLQQARLALTTGHGDTAVELAATVAADARSRGTPRYAVLAEILVARARHASGADTPDHLDDLLHELPRIAGLEAWWVTMEVACELDSGPWKAASAQLVERLASANALHAARLRAFARDRLDRLERKAR